MSKKKHLERMTVAKLKDICTEYNITKSGNKVEIIDRIIGEKDITVNEIKNINHANILKECLNFSTTVDLKSFCRKKQISQYGTKDTIIKRIIDEVSNDDIIKFLNAEAKKSFKKESLEDLRSVCVDCKITFTGTKAEIIERLVDLSVKPLSYDVSKINSKQTKSGSSKHESGAITSAVRNTVWNLYMGHTNKTGKCLCCSQEDISYPNFHCGHIISRKFGGEITVENLRPICASCNCSIGTKNMETFMAEHKFPKNPNWSGYKENSDIYSELKKEISDLKEQLSMFKTESVNKTSKKK